MLQATKPPRTNGHYNGNGHHNGGGQHNQRAVKAASVTMPPNNEDAEETLLGMIMVDPALKSDVGELDAGDFHWGLNAQVFQAIIDTDGSYIAVIEYLGDDINPALVTDRLIRAQEIFPLPDIKMLASIIKRASMMRQLIHAATDIAQLAYANPGEKELDEILDEAGRLVFSVIQSRPDDKIKSIMSGVQEVLARVERIQNGEEVAGIPTGIKDLDKLLGGLRGGKFYIAAGRPGMGKSTFAHQVMFHLGQRGQRSLLFSLEMDNEEVAQRLIAMQTGIDSHKIGLGEVSFDDLPSLYNGGQVVGDMPIIIDDGATSTINGMRNKARIIQSQVGLDLLLVDYLQLMNGVAKESENRQQEISYISRGLKMIARELNIPVLALSQLSRACESRKDKRPILSDLRESGSLEQDTDAVMFFYRDELYNPDSEFPNIAEIILGKHRQGGTGSFSVYFKKRVNQFVDLEVRSRPLEY
jgi:replicative DNA helicase